MYHWTMLHPCRLKCQIHSLCSLSYTLVELHSGGVCQCIYLYCIDIQYHCPTGMILDIQYQYPTSIVLYIQFQYPTGILLYKQYQYPTGILLYLYVVQVGYYLLLARTILSASSQDLNI